MFFTPQKTLFYILISFLIHKKTKQRAELNEKVAQLEYSLEDENFDKAELERLYNDAKVVLFNPGLLWEH